MEVSFILCQTWFMIFQSVCLRVILYLSKYFTSVIIHVFLVLRCKLAHNTHFHIYVAFFSDYLKICCYVCMSVCVKGSRTWRNLHDIKLISDEFFLWNNRYFRVKYTWNVIDWLNLSVLMSVFSTWKTVTRTTCLQRTVVVEDSTPWHTPTDVPASALSGIVNFLCSYQE